MARWVPPRATASPAVRFVTYAALLTVAPTVFGFDYSLAIGPGQIYIADFLVPLAALVAFSQVRGGRLPVVVFLVGVLLAAVTLLGLYNDAEFRWILRDARGMVYFTCGIIIGGLIYQSPRSWPWLLRTVWIFLAAVAVLLVLSHQWSIVTGDETNVIDYNGRPTELEGQRFRIATDPLALLVLSGLLASLVAGIRSGLARPIVFGLVVSAGFIIFVSYSRNTLLGLVAAGLFAVLTPGTGGRTAQFLRAGRGVTTVSVIGCALLLAALTFPATRGSVQTFGDRVFDGLTSQALQTDPSIDWRARETETGVAAVTSHPFIGRGFGVFYRDRLVHEFSADPGFRLYMHNYYLWLLAKGGVVLFGAMLLLFAWALAGFRAMSRRSDGHAAVGAGLASIAACAFVAPWPAQVDGAAVVGMVIGAGIAASSEARRQRHEGIPTLTGVAPVASVT